MTRRIQLVALDDLARAPRNPKGHAVEDIDASMTRHGVVELITLDERTGRIVAGHGRLDALTARRDRGEPPPEGVTVRKGAWLVPVVRGWASSDDAAAEAYLVASNRLTEKGGWDDAGLAELLGELVAVPEGLAGTGYTHVEFDALIKSLAPEPVANTDPDDVPEVPAEPVTEPGDLWLLGPHRVLCGDAMKRVTLAALLDDERPEVLLTDPPYGVSHGSGITDAKAIRGDIGQAVIPVGFAVALEFLDENARLYVFGGSEQMSMYSGIWDHHLGAFPRVIVWVKSPFVLRQLAYHSQFELCYWGWKGAGGKREFWFGDRTVSDVWQVPRAEEAERVHPTQKPVDLLRVPVRYSAPAGGLVLDPFAGSGTTLIACHAEDRVARLIELDPAYVDVICRRYQEHTGTVPVLERTGKAHDFIG